MDESSGRKPRKVDSQVQAPRLLAEKGDGVGTSLQDRNAPSVFNLPLFLLSPRNITTLALRGDPDEATGWHQGTGRRLESDLGPSHFFADGSADFIERIYSG